MTQSSGNPQPPQISVSGSIIIQGHLTTPSSPSIESAPLTLPSSRWKFWRRWKDERVTAYATLLLATGTVALAIFSLIQIRDFRDQEQRQLRAYIGILDHKIENLAVGQTPSITLIFKNFGATPARNIKYWAESHLDQFSAKDFKPDRLVLFPSDVFSATWTTNPFDEKDIDNLKKGETTLFVYGEIDYLDAFNCERDTKFRLIYTGDLLRVGRLGWAPQGNDVEALCRADGR